VFHDRAKISDENKQRLARKMNYSEVTFIESLEPSEAMMSAFSIQ
jgi:predicted PhzF superfamily epimerase YddE/YHI9